jgi:hypothetical protein
MYTRKNRLPSCRRSERILPSLTTLQRYDAVEKAHFRSPVFISPSPITICSVLTIITNTFVSRLTQECLRRTLADLLSYVSFGLRRPLILPSSSTWSLMKLRLLRRRGDGNGLNLLLGVSVLFPLPIVSGCNPDNTACPRMSVFKALFEVSKDCNRTQSSSARRRTCSFLRRLYLLMSIIRY